MPSLPHEALVALFDNRLGLAAELLRESLGVDLPAWTVARREAGDLGQLAPTEYHADLVVVLDGGATRVAIVVEVQLRRDEEKRASLPVYLVTLRARLRCAVILLVIAPTPSVARWAAEPIDLGHPGLVLQPLVLSATTAPAVTDAEQARTSPELAVLSALLHGRGDPGRAVAIATAALDAAACLDDARSRIYADLVLLGLGEAARGALEAMMIPEKYEYRSDFARKYFGAGKAEGRAEGEIEGEAKGKVDALFVILGARGLVPTAEQRERIVAERDGACLDGWLAKAVTASDVDALLLGDGAG